MLICIVITTKDEIEYSIIRIGNTIVNYSKFDIGVFVCFNMPIGLNRATILALLRGPSELIMTVPWAYNASNAALLPCWIGWGRTCPVNSFHALSVSVLWWRWDQVVLITITLLFGAQQSVLGRYTLYLDRAKCKVWVFAIQCSLPEGNK